MKAGDRIHRQTNLVILASTLRAILARKLLPITEELGPCAALQQVQRAGHNELLHVSSNSKERRRHAWLLRMLHTIEV